MDDGSGLSDELNELTETSTEQFTEPASQRGAGETDGCLHCSRLRPSVEPAELAPCHRTERHTQFESLPPPRPPTPPPQPLFTLYKSSPTRLLLPLIAFCALVGVVVSSALAVLERDSADYRSGGSGSSDCHNATLSEAEFGKAVREVVERFYGKALPTLRGHVRQPPAAFLPFAVDSDEGECTLASGSFRAAVHDSHGEASTAFAVTEQGRLRVLNSGYYYVFAQVGAQRLPANTEQVDVTLSTVRSPAERSLLSNSAPNTTIVQGKDVPSVIEQEDRRAEERLTLASVTPLASGSGSGSYVETPPVFTARVVRLWGGDELCLRLSCDRSGSPGHRCGFASIAAAEACGRYRLGAHMIAPASASIAHH